MSLEEIKYPGLLIDTIIVKDAQSKNIAQDALYGWQYVELTAREWIEHLEAGHIIQPSTFIPTPDGSYSHSKGYWKSTTFICCDADNIQAVEFLTNRQDKNPNGIRPFTEERGLSQRYPTLRNKVYAVTQSVSSMHTDRPHRRYRLIFHFDQPITSEKHYHQILLALSREFPIIPPVERSPAQPVFGNAREGYNRAAIPGNLLSLSDYPYHEPQPPQFNRDTQERDGATNDDLYRLLVENNISFEVRPRGGFYVRCPNSDQHTGGICGPTDSYVFIGDLRALAFHCSHASCQTTGMSTWAAFRNGYTLRTTTRSYTAKQRLHIKTEAEHIKTDTMDTIRTLLKNDVLEWLWKVYDSEKTQVLIVNLGTATGKTYTIIDNIDNLLMLSTTIEQAQEKYDQALELGKIAVLHVSRWNHWSQYRVYLENPNMNRDDLKMSLTDPNGVACKEPEKCEAIFQKGHSAREKFCELRCPYRGECKNHGYLSQFRLYQNTNEPRLQVYTAQPQEAVTDADLQETIRAYGLNRDGTVVVVDEADPMKMIPLRQVSYENWKKARWEYDGTYTGVFFEMLLRETATVVERVEAEDTQDYIQRVNENGLAFRDAIQRAFNAFEAHVAQYDHTLIYGLKIVQEQLEIVARKGLDDVEIDSPLTAQLYDGHPTKIEAQIQGLPHNHTRLIDNLKALLDTTHDSQKPPVRNVGKGVWEFAVPPTLNAQKNIYLTANYITPLIRTQLRNVDAEIQTTQNLVATWKPDNIIYMLNSGRYTPRSLFKVPKKTMYKSSGEEIQVDDTGELRNAGKTLVGLTIATLTDGIDTLIVAPKAFCEDGILYQDPLIQKLHALPNSHVATHQHAIGVNRYSELPRAIIYHYEPHILDLIFVTKAIYPNHTLDFTREKVTLVQHGLILQGVYRYRDERVQHVYDAMCSNTMMQSENRIRPQLYENKEIWRLSTEPIPAPVTPRLFSIRDWQAWTETDRTQNFDTFLRERANRRVAEVAAEDNVSERTAYRRTQPTRRENTIDRDAEIIRLHKLGHKQSDIALHVSRFFGKTSQPTVSRVIKQFTQ